MRFICLAAVLLLPSLASAQQPSAPSIDDQIAKYIAAKSAVEKAQATLKQAETDLRATWKAINDKMAELGITPAPTPPPVPPVPPPVDLLAVKLKTAFTTDAGTKDQALNLAALYRQAAKLAADTTVPSTAELLRRVREASASLIGAEALPALRGAVAGELAATLGTPSDAALTAAQRAAAAALFAKLAVILEAF